MDFESVYDPTFVMDVEEIKEKVDKLADAVAELTNKAPVQLDFSIPDKPEYYYDKESGVLIIYDVNEIPHTIELPEKEDGTVDLPVNVIDNDKKVYEVKEKDEKLVLEVAKNQQIHNNAHAGSKEDYYTYFIIKKLNKNESITVSEAEKIVRETPKEKYYRDAINLEAGRYICIPVRKMIRYVYVNSLRESGKDTVSRDFKGFIPFVTTNYRDYEPLSRWDENPYNKYSMYRTYNNKTDTLTNVYYAILDLTEGTHQIYSRRYSEQGKVFCDGVRPDTFIRVISYVGTLKIAVEKKSDAGAVWFERDELTYDGSFGFDRYHDKLAAFKLKYQTDKFDIVKSDGSKIEYHVPSVSAWTNQRIKIKAKINENTASTDSVYCKFVSGNGLIVEDIRHNGVSCVNGQKEFSGPNGNYELEIILTGSVQESVLTVFDRSGKTIGKLNFFTEDTERSEKITLITYKIVNVTFGNTVSDAVMSKYAQGNLLDTYLNSHSFNQAFTQVQHKGSSDLTIDSALIDRKGIKYIASQLENIDENKGAIRDLLESEYKKAGGTIDEDERILFLINNRQMIDVGGYAPYSRKPDAGYSIVIFKSNANNWETFVHEIGHTFGLEHPFDDKSYIKGSTTNFMDYTPKMDMFWKWQWKIINTKNFK
jgi:hypothetical protein